MNNQSNLIGNTCTIFNNVLIFDDFTNIIKIIVLLSAVFTIFISFDYIKGQKINSFEYIILILIATLSMLFIISSFDLISIYLAIELQSLSFYVLAAYQRNNEFSTEAGLKYFILGALSSGFLLFGESIIYGFTGITNLEELTKVFAFNSIEGNSIQSIDIALLNDGILTNLEYIINSNNAIYIGLLFMLVAFLFKIGAVPFHM
jgi:NADH:ubiquinone oxidoreductase subunit 2 (subunit N)